MEVSVPRREVIALSEAKVQEESKVIKKLRVVKSPLINTFEGFYSYPRWLVLSNFAESRITWETDLWAWLWEITLVLYFEEGDTPIMGATVPWLGS